MRADLPHPVCRLAGLLLLPLFLGQVLRWEAAQAGAWASMIRDFTDQGLSLARAMEKTFEGQSPCSACDRLAKEKTSQDTDTPAVTAPRLHEAHPLAPALRPPPLLPPLQARGSRPGRTTLFPSTSPPRPPVPPPRRS